MFQYKLFYVLLNVILVGITLGISFRNDVCKVYTKDECMCYKAINSGDLQDKATQRRVPVDCAYSCALHPCCNGRTDNRCSGKDMCHGITMVTRQQWKAKNATGPVGEITNPVSQFYIHHTDGNQCSDIQSCAKVLRSIQEYHMSLGWYDIGYSFLIGQDGRVYEGRGWNKVGAHTEGYNSVSYAASFMGNYMEQLPDLKSLNAAKQLIACGIELGKITQLYTLYGHRDACGDTDCPGNALYKNIQQWKYFNRTANPSSECVALGRRCKSDKNTCKTGSLIVGPSLCKGPCKNCCYKA